MSRVITKLLPATDVGPSTQPSNSQHILFYPHILSPMISTNSTRQSMLYNDVGKKIENSICSIVIRRKHTRDEARESVNKAMDNNLVTNKTYYLT